MIKISVIITCYNEEEFIADAINSVLNQTTFFEYIEEVIVVDDGSSDGSKDVIEEIIAENPDKNITYIYQENAGLAAARNTGIKQASGDYIALLDGDDVWLENKIEEQVKVIKTYPDVGLVYTDPYTVNLSLENMRRNFANSYSFTNGNVLEELFKKGGPIIPSTVIINTNCFEKVELFDEELLKGQDTDMWLRIAKFFRLHHVSELLILKRERNDSLGANTEKKAEYLLYITNKITNLYPELEQYKAKREAKIYNGITIYLLEKGDRLKALKAAFKTIQLDQSRFRYYCFLIFSLLPMPSSFFPKMFTFFREVKEGVLKRAI